MTLMVIARHARENALQTKIVLEWNVTIGIKEIAFGSIDIVTNRLQKRLHTTKITKPA